MSRLTNPIRKNVSKNLKIQIIKICKNGIDFDELFILDWRYLSRMGLIIISVCFCYLDSKISSSIHGGRILFLVSKQYNTMRYYHSHTPSQNHSINTKKKIHNIHSQTYLFLQITSAALQCEQIHSMKTVLS